jgi:minor tail protein Z (GPZ)
LPDQLLPITVEFDTKAFAEAINALVPPKADKAIALALRQTSKNAKVRASGLIAKHMGTKTSTIKDRIYTDFVQPGIHVTHIRASRKPIPLGEFPHTQTAAGVMTRAWGRPQVLRGAFSATMRTGHAGIFRRRPGAGRLPIYELWGPTIAGTFLTPVVRNAIEARIKEQLPKNLTRDLRAAMRRSGLPTDGA